MPFEIGQPRRYEQDLPLAGGRMGALDARNLRWAAVACALLIYVFPLFLGTPLFDPDEGLHASIAQEMVEQGDYLVPRLMGKPFLDKPILYFWVQALSLHVFGMHEFAVRVPGLLFGLMAALTTGWLARVLFDRATGLVATLVAMTLAMPLIVAQAATHDVALVSCTNLALLCLWQADKHPSRGMRGLLTAGAGLGMGLGILTKGLLGIALIALGYGLFVLWSRRLSIAIVVRSVSALLLGLLVASPWYLAVESRVPGYLHYYFIERHIHGFTSTTQIHGHEPVYYYFPYIVLGSLPWCWYLFPLLRSEWRRIREGRGTPEVQLLVIWLCSGLLFLTIAKSKLFTYALPLYPAIAILASLGWRRFIATQQADAQVVDPATANGLGRIAAPLECEQFARYVRLGMFPALIAPPVSLAIVMHVLELSSGWIFWSVILLASILPLYAWRQLERGKPSLSLGSSALWFSLIFAAVMAGPVQGVAVRRSMPTVAEWLNTQDRLPNEIVLVGNRIGSVIFYLKPSMRQQLRADTFRLLHVRDLGSMPSISRDTLLVVDHEEFGVVRHQGIQIDAPGWVTSGRQHVFTGPGRIGAALAGNRLMHATNPADQHN